MRSSACSLMTRVALDLELAGTFCSTVLWYRYYVPTDPTYGKEPLLAHYRVRNRPTGRVGKNGDASLEYFITIPVWAAREMPKDAEFEFDLTERGFEYSVPSLRTPPD